MFDDERDSELNEMGIEEYLVDSSLREFSLLHKIQSDLFEEIVMLIHQKKLIIEAEYESFIKRNTDKSMRFQIGYTPNNLKKLIDISGLSQRYFYEYLNKSRNAFGRYLLPVEDANHVTMKHKDWEQVLNHVATIISERRKDGDK